MLWFPNSGYGVTKFVLDTRKKKKYKDLSLRPSMRRENCSSWQSTGR